MNPFAPLLSVEWLSLLLGDLLRAQTKQISSVNRSFFESLYLSHFTFMIIFFIFLRTLVKRAHVKQTHELNLGFGFSDGQNSSQHIFFYNTVLLYYIFY